MAASKECIRTDGMVPIKGGSALGHWAGAKDSFPHVNRLPTDKKPSHENVDALLKEHGDRHKVMMQNKVKKCPAAGCRKPCAFTLKTCNACGETLGSEIESTENIFMSFIFGVARGPFPYTISLRRESERFMVFDDLLALAPAHFNVIPTFAHIPDWRYLLTAPKEGLELLCALRDEGRAAMKAQFWDNKDFKAKFWASVDDLDSIIIAGANYPPSQYQLHMQFLCAPLIPFQYSQFKDGNHFHHNRFFSYEYIEAALKVAITESLKFEITEVTPIAEITATIDKYGVRYDDIHKKQLERYHAAHQRCTWEPADFLDIIDKDVVLDRNMQKTNKDPKKLQQDDKLVLQNYGRPYKDGRTSGSYYSFPRNPSDLVAFGLSSSASMKSNVNKSAKS